MKRKNGFQLHPHFLESDTFLAVHAWTASVICLKEKKADISNVTNVSIDLKNLFIYLNR